MNSLDREIAAFTAAKEEQAALAHQTAALQLLCGVDLNTALSVGGVERTRLIRRIARCLERERLKGGRGSSTYSLDRHIALKRLMDRMRGKSSKPDAASRQKRSGAGRRRFASK